MIPPPRSLLKLNKKGKEKEVQGKEVEPVVPQFDPTEKQRIIIMIHDKKQHTVVQAGKERARRPETQATLLDGRGYEPYHTDPLRGPRLS